MKKLLGALAGIIIIAIILIILFGKFGIGFGAGSEGDSQDDSGTRMNPEAEYNTNEKEPDVVVLPTDDTSSKPEEENNRVAVSVVKNEYFYENKSIELDVFMQILNENEEQLCVEITDDNASRKAYNNLIDALELAGIVFVEMNVD